MYIDDPRPLHYQMISETPQLRPSSIDLIVRMNHLTKISIRSVAIQFSGFLRICREFENLQYVGAEEILVDVPIPNIKTVLATFNTAFDHQEYNERTFPTKFGIIFKKTDSVEHYREGNVKLDDSIFVDSLPELTHLATSCGSRFEENQRHMMNFQHVLSTVGGSLKKLTLSDFNQTSKLTFKNIFEHCQNLESLYLISSYIADANEPINSFGKLKEFCWDNSSGPHYTISLDSILHAPLLEKINVKAYEFDLDDKEVLLNRIRNGEICTNVKEFMVDDKTSDDAPVWKDFFDLFDAIRMNSPEPVSTSLETNNRLRPYRFSFWKH